MAETHAGVAQVVELINRTIRRLNSKPNLLRSCEWNHPETLNVEGINSAAQAIGVGPIFAIGEAPDWVRAPNLPLDHPVNTRKVECLTVYHPDGSEYRVRRTGGELDDISTLPIRETVARLEAWAQSATELGISEPIRRDKRRRNRRRGGQKIYDEKKDSRIASDWKVAKRLMTKEDFVESRELCRHRLDGQRVKIDTVKKLVSVLNAVNRRSKARTKKRSNANHKTR